MTSHKMGTLKHQKHCRLKITILMQVNHRTASRHFRWVHFLRSLKFTLAELPPVSRRITVFSCAVSCCRAFAKTILRAIFHESFVAGVLVFVKAFYFNTPPNDHLGWDLWKLWFLFLLLRATCEHLLSSNPWSCGDAVLEKTWPQGKKKLKY